MLDSNYKTTTKLLIWIAGTIILLYLVYLLTEVIIIIAISILLAFIFAPFVSSLEERGFNRLTSTFLVFGVFGLIIYLSLSVIIPKLFFQMNQLVGALQGFSFDEEMKALEASLIHYLPFLEPGSLTTRVESFFSSQLTLAINSISEVLSSIVSVIAVLVIVPFITFFLLKDHRRILQGIIHTVPNKYFEISYYVLKVFLMHYRSD